MSREHPRPPFRGLAAPSSERAEACHPRAPRQRERARCSRASSPCLPVSTEQAHFAISGRPSLPGTEDLLHPGRPGRTLRRGAGGGIAGSASGGPGDDAGLVVGSRPCLKPGPWQTSHCTFSQPVDVHHCASAGLLVAGHVAAHALEVELLELRGERRVGMAWWSRSTPRAAPGGTSCTHRCRGTSPGRVPRGGGRRPAKAARLWSFHRSRNTKAMSSLDAWSLPSESRISLMA